MLKKFLVLVAALVMTVVGLSGTATAQVDPWTDCANTASTPLTGTYRNVEVSEFASCYMEGAVVTGNFFARNTPNNVVLLNTEFAHNVRVYGATGQTTIGIAGCRQDPPIGNNIRVTDSHNVLICQMTVDNNITVKRNDGRITVRQSSAGNNVFVDRNKRYNPKAGDGTHRAAGDIRLFGVHADNHVFVRLNKRDLRLRNVTADNDVKVVTWE
jgi:hypothetical protein